MMIIKNLKAGISCLLFIVGSYAPAVFAGDAVISIIIDDLGSDNPRHEQVVRLPGAITCSFLPLYKASYRLAKLAHSYNKEILLHLPMESIKQKPMGPGGLSLDMTEQEFIWAMQKDLASVPHAIGINNHMGSLLTRHPGHMVWLMKEMKRNGKLLFVDSRTTRNSIAKAVAVEQGVPSLARNIFLDHDADEHSIRRQFSRMIALAKRKGSALAIGHPHASTIKVLREMLPKLKGMGVRLVAVSELLNIKRERQKLWQASLSRSPKAAKNLKP